MQSEKHSSLFQLTLAVTGFKKVSTWLMRWLMAQKITTRCTTLCSELGPCHRMKSATSTSSIWSQLTFMSTWGNTLLLKKSARAICSRTPASNSRLIFTQSRTQRRLWHSTLSFQPGSCKSKKHRSTWAHSYRKREWSTTIYKSNLGSRPTCRPGPLKVLPRGMYTLWVSRRKR